MDIGTRRTKKKAFLRTYWSVRDEIRGGVRLSTYLRQIFQRNLVSNLKTRVLRVILYPFALVSSKSRPSLPTDGLFSNPDDWNEYKKKNGGLYLEIAQRFNDEGALSFLSPAGNWIFSTRRSEATILELSELNEKDAS